MRQSEAELLMCPRQQCHRTAVWAVFPLLLAQASMSFKQDHRQTFIESLCTACFPDAWGSSMRAPGLAHIYDCPYPCCASVHAHTDTNTYGLVAKQSSKSLKGRRPEPLQKNTGQAGSHCPRYTQAARAGKARHTTEYNARHLALGTIANWSKARFLPGICSRLCCGGTSSTSWVRGGEGGGRR